MAERVVFHVGVPKSGTTHLQTTMWHNHDRLREQGVLLPGRRRGDHALASFAVREDRGTAGRPNAAPEAWERILTDVAAWPGTAVISHEFFGAATTEQACRAIESLRPAEVHLVVTARDALSAFTAAWQETLKYRRTTPLDEFNVHEGGGPADVWGWRNLDASEVLERWAVGLPAERTHLVVRPRQRTTEPVLWRRFAGLFTEDPDGFDLSRSARNESMGVVEAELLRRVTPHLASLEGGPGIRNWLRDYLAGQKLVARSGERFLPGQRLLDDCRERSGRMVARLSAADYHVVGDLDDLLVPADLPPLRRPDEVGEAELLDAAVEILADVLLDLRSTQHELKTSRRRRARLLDAARGE